MKVQMEWLMFIFVANLVTGFVMNAKTTAGNPVVPGVKYMQALNQTGNATDYETMINATELIGSIQPPANFWEYTIVTFTSAMNFFRMISWIWDGFAQMIDYWASFIPSYGAISIFRQFGNILRVISAFMFVTVILEFFRGIKILP